MDWAMMQTNGVSRLPVTGQARHNANGDTPAKYLCSQRA